MKHKLKIVSLSDAQLACKCGWHMVRTGTMTRQEVAKEYNKHIMQTNPKEEKFKDARNTQNIFS